MGAIIRKNREHKHPKYCDSSNSSNDNGEYNEIVTIKSWEEFRNSGLLWWINMILHTFGWAIVTEIDKGKIVDVNPARVKFRGFAERNNTEGYVKVSKYMNNTAEKLLEEAEDS